jgi:hypothetical protein
MCLQILFVLFASQLGASHSLRLKKNQTAVKHLPPLCYDIHDTVTKRVLISPQSDREGKELQRPNTGFIQHTPHEAQYTS